MKTVNLSDESGDKENPPEPSGRQKRLLVVFLVVLLVGAAAIAAQQFFFKEKKPALAPERGPVATVAPSVPVTPAPSVKPLEPVQPSPAGQVSAPSFPPPPAAGPKTEQAQEPPKPPGVETSPAVPAPSVKPLEPVQPSPAGQVSAPSFPPPPAAGPKTEQAQEPPKPSKPARQAFSEGGKAHPVKGYALQVVACADEKKALEHKKKLKAEGFSSRIVKGRATLTKHSVYVGDFSGPEEAAALGLRLKEDGIGATLLMTEGGRYSFLISSYFTLNEAIDASHGLENKGYPARIRETTGQSPVYRVRIEHFADRDQAAALVGRLRGLGYSPVVVRE